MELTIQPVLICIHVYMHTEKETYEV